MSGPRSNRRTWRQLVGRYLARCLALAVAVPAALTLTTAPSLAVTGDGSPTDANIRYVGRWDFSNPSAPTASWTGAYVVTGFTGTTVRLRLRNTIDVWVSIDGGNYRRYSNVSGTVNLTPTPLRAGNHQLRVSYRAIAGSYRGDSAFLGVALDPGATTLPGAIRPHLLEFVGDSITVGQTSSQISLTSFPWLVGERLGAEHTQIAQGGACLVASADGCVGMARQFSKVGSAASSPEWDFRRYTADAVVITLGINDGGHSVTAAQFQRDYTGLLATARQKYPRAALFAMRNFKGRYAEQTIAAVRARNAAGDANVRFIDTTGWLDLAVDSGDNQHPNDQGHRKVTERLAPILAPYLSSVPVPTSPTVPVTTAPVPTPPVTPAAGSTLVSVASNRCLSAAAATAGSAVQIYDCTGSTTQQWTFTPTGELRTNNATLCLDATARGTTPGTKLTVYTCNGGPNQKFTRGPNQSIVGQQSNLCLDVERRATTNGTPVNLWTCNAGSNQQWTAATTTPPVTPTTPATTPTTPATTPTTPVTTQPTTPATTPASTPPATGTCSVTYTVTNAWTGGFTAEVKISSTTPVNGWTATWTFPGTETITNAWNATITQNNRAVTATNAAFNATIPAGGSATIGFQGTTTATPQTPTTFTLNGTTCS